MPLLFSPTQRGLSDLKAGEACQKQAEAVPEKPATSRLFNVRSTIFPAQHSSLQHTRNYLIKISKPLLQPLNRPPPLLCPRPILITKHPSLPHSLAHWYGL